jgi:hypothetical protein
MDANPNPTSKEPPVYAFVAWVSPVVGVVVSLVLWLWIVNHPSVRGERPMPALLFDLSLLVVSAVGGLAAVVSFFGIRSWTSALVIVPGALLGICINGANAVMSYLAYALEGRNLGG